MCALPSCVDGSCHTDSGHTPTQSGCHSGPSSERLAISRDARPCGALAARRAQRSHATIRGDRAPRRMRTKPSDARRGGPVRSTLSGSRTSRKRSGRVRPVAHAVRTHWPVVRSIAVGALERGLTLIRGSKGGFMRRVAGVIASAVVVLLVLPSRLAAQGGIIWGRVADTTGALLARATVSVEATGGRTTSNDQGNYEIRRVPAGTHTVRVRLLGHVAQTVRIAMSEEQTVRQDFWLRRQPIGLAPVDLVVGSRARHTGAEELAVPVDVYPAEALAQQGTGETNPILQALTASVNFPRQSVTDANDIVRPFTLRGLSPDHTLVLLNGWRRHQTALVNNFAYGMAAGSSGVDLNAIPASAIDRIEVLRDGASAPYGSDAIAGGVNIVTQERQFTPVVNVDTGRDVTDHHPDDGQTVDVNGGWGIGLGRGSLALVGEFLDRQPTNRAWADPFETSVTGLADSIDNRGRVVVKRNPVPQPNHHWGDGLEKDIMTLGNLRLPLNAAGTSEIYAFGGDRLHATTGQPFPRYWADSRKWPAPYPPGFFSRFP